MKLCSCGTDGGEVSGGPQIEGEDGGAGRGGGGTHEGFAKVPVHDGGKIAPRGVLEGRSSHVSRRDPAVHTGPRGSPRVAHRLLFTPAPPSSLAQRSRFGRSVGRRGNEKTRRYFFGEETTTGGGAVKKRSLFQKCWCIRFSLRNVGHTLVAPRLQDSPVKVVKEEKRRGACCLDFFESNENAYTGDWGGRTEKPRAEASCRAERKEPCRRAACCWCCCL